ncbi:MAG: 3-oxoacyl-ACP synthase, partial [Rhizobiales bacterium]|nr:3-oxoacyl-ACP synthase [Hyphomicrobiales bacterium]
MLRSVVLGCGAYLPEKIMTNDDIAKFVDTTHDWVVERSGIHQRHIAADGELTSDLALAASKHALERAGLDAQDIDLIV